MIEFLKVWTDEKHLKGYGEKVCFLDPRAPFEQIESFIVKDKTNKQNGEMECTKITYPGGIKFIVVQGNPFEFMEKFRNHEISVCLLGDLYSNGLTIKQFLEANERKNGIQPL